MRLPGRLSAAIEVLTVVDAQHRPVAVALKEWGASHRFAGSGDRAAIGNLVYDALRKRASHAHAMGSDNPRALVLSVAVRGWGEDPEVLNASFEDDKFAPDAITADEKKKLLDPNSLDGAEDAVRADIPSWIAPSLQDNFGDEWIAEGQAMSERPPLDMRVNLLKADQARVLKALQRFKPQPAEIAPTGVRIAAGSGDARTPNVQADQSFLKGWLEIQDQGSQLVALLAGAQPGEQVLDLCAGAGGKTLALAAMMQNKGQIFAYDENRNRLAPIYDRLKRNGARNVQVRAPGDSALDDLVGKMDRVLVDAPCTGTGTWRRRPDAKWKLTPEQLGKRQEEQAAILHNAAQFVRPGGQLIYITCSILPEENQLQVQSFLQDVSDFSVCTLQDVWQTQLGDQVPAPHFCDEGLTLTPAKTGTDGFFLSIVQRAKKS